MATKTTTEGMTDATANERAAALRALHVPGNPLVVPNVWDAASARTVEAAGFPVVATGSAAIAPVLGYDDGEAAPVEEMLAAVARIVRAVGVPVTADMERGYGLKPAELVARLAATGAVGCNLEDSDPRTGEMVDADEQAAFLGAVRAAATEAGVDLVINARVDTYMNGTGTPPTAANRYGAGACTCEPAPTASTRSSSPTPASSARWPGRSTARSTSCSVPARPSIGELSALGVARVSFGHGLHRAVQAYTAQMVAAIQAGNSPYPPGVTAG